MFALIFDGIVLDQIITDGCQEFICAHPTETWCANLFELQLYFLLTYIVYVASDK